MDLESGLGTKSFVFRYTFGSGAQCLADVTFSGDEDAGTAIVSGGIFDTGSGETDPGCSGLNGGYTYKRKDSRLELCSKSECVGYK